MKGELHNLHNFAIKPVVHANHSFSSVSLQSVGGMPFQQ